MERVYQWLGASRQALLLRLHARVHWGLVGGTVCVVLSEYLRMMGLTQGLPVLPLFLRGLLFGIPVALSFYAETRLPAMWQFLLASVGIALVSWGLLGHLGGLVMGGGAGVFPAAQAPSPGDEALGFRGAQSLVFHPVLLRLWLQRVLPSSPGAEAGGGLPGAGPAALRRRKAAGPAGPLPGRRAGTSTACPPGASCALWGRRWGPGPCWGAPSCWCRRC